MPDRSNPYSQTEQNLDLPEVEPDTAALLDSQVQKAQEQLLQLKRQSELLERQKRELEDLSQRQEELERGRNDMIEKLSRSLTVIERESIEAERRVEHLQATHRAFTEHLDVLEAINPKNWPSNDLARELSKAQSDVDDARAIYAKNRAKIEAPIDEESAVALSGSGYSSEAGEPQGFLYWFNAGFAFTLPLVLILAILALAIYLTNK